MRKGKRFLVSMTVVFAFILLAPSLALADNCSSLLDCFSNAAAAAAAAAGAGAAAGIAGLPKVQRRKLDPCKVMEYLFWLAIIVTIVSVFIAIWLVTKFGPIIVILAEGGPLTLVSVFILLGVIFGLASLILLTLWMWLEYFRYRKLCKGGTP